MKTGAGNLKRGDFIDYQDAIWQVQKADFYSPGKGSALMKVRIKNLLSGKNVDYAYKSSETVETLAVESIEMQYLYKDHEYVYLMDERTYNQYQVSLEVVSDFADFLKEGNKYFVYVYNEKALSVRPPLSVKLKVIETEDAAKGDTVSGARKPATLETGVVIQVPLFVKKNEFVMVNPETGLYTERAKE